MHGFKTGLKFEQRQRLNNVKSKAVRWTGRVHGVRGNLLRQTQVSEHFALNILFLLVKISATKGSLLVFEI